MRGLLEELGLEYTERVTAATVHASFTVQETGAYLDAVLGDQRAAARVAVGPFLRPGSIALVGASDKPGSVGELLLANLLKSGFAGRHALYGRPVYARLRAALGGPAWVISGGAPLNEDLAHFLHGAGINILEGWGMTETVGQVTMNRPASRPIGSVGLTLPGHAVRISADGEIEVEGPSVCHGYWQDPQATSEAFDSGWLRTGDLGRLDDDGFLYMTGRKKENLITAGGQHVVPSVLEDTVREHWLIAECVVVGDQRPYVVALITLDEEAFARWKQRRGKPTEATIGELRDDPDLCAVVQQAVDRANAAVSRPETIKRFRILPGQFQVGAELTPTGKVRREYVLAKYASDVDALYPQGGPAVPPGSR